MSDDCIHGLSVEWCAICTRADPAPVDRVGEYGWHGGATKQDLLDELCDLLGVPRRLVARGSSLPSDVFAEAASQADVAFGSMPEIAEAIVNKAGRPWSPSFDSRGSASGGGSTVTFEGLRAMIDALRSLSTSQGRDI